MFNQWRSNFKVILQILLMNWRKVISIILLGLYAGFWAVPTLLSKDSALSFKPEWHPVLFLLLLTLGFLLTAIYRSILKLWVRYLKNYSLREVPFTFIDGIALFCLVTGVAIYFSWGISGQQLIISPLGEGLLIVVGGFFLIFCVAIYLKGRTLATAFNTQSPRVQNVYFIDEPITTEEEDLLNRKQFVEDLCSQIVAYPLPESFVFGLYGKWGEGKTSIVNLVRNKLNEREDVLVFDFDPCVFSSTEALIENFYDGIRKCLNQRFLLPNLRKLIIRYRKLLVSGLKFKGFDFDLSWTDETLEQLKSKIEAQIEKTGAKLVIFIDDIDRLRDKNDLLQIFKLVKLSGRFKNTVYVLSFDHEEVNKILNPNRPGNFSFLEKFIQAPIHLPPADQESIDHYLYFSTKDRQVSAIHKLFDRLQIDSQRIEDFEKNFTTIYITQFSTLFYSLRRAKIYLNGLYQRLPSIKDEIHLQDFLILEAIRVFYPQVYKDMTDYPWFYLPAWGEAALLSFPFEFKSSDQRPHSLIKQHFNTLSESLENPEVLLELLQVLFFEVRKAISVMLP